MQVRAERAGFYQGRLLQAGDVFTVAQGHRASWFVPLDDDAAQATSAEPADMGKPQTAPGKPPAGAPVTPKPRRGRPPSSGSTAPTPPAPPAPTDPDSP